MKKKLLSILLSVGICVSLSACSIAREIATEIVRRGDTATAEYSDSADAGALQVNDSSRFGTYGDDEEAGESGAVQIELDGFYNSVSTDGEYSIEIPGHSVVAEGVAGAPFSFYFPSDSGGYYDSFIGAIALPVDDEIAAMEAKMPTMGKEFEQYAQQAFGYLLHGFSYQIIEYEGSHIYKSYFVLHDKKNKLEVTTCYRFEQSYYEFVLGINYGDLPQVHSMTVDAAKHFVDDTMAPMSAMPSMFFSAEYTVDLPAWEYPITNGFGSVKEHTVRVFRDQISPERQADDYEIVWKTEYMEEFARAVSGVESGSVMSSDLDLVTTLRISGGNAGRGVYEFSDDHTGIRLETDKLMISFDDFEHFANVKLLDIDISTITDITALSAMPQVEEMYIFLSEDITDLNPIGDVKELRQLMMWGRDYSKVTDVSFVKNLQNAENIMFFGTGVKDITPFFSLPKLTTLGLIVHDDADTSMCKQYAGQFETFFVNGEDFG